MKITTISTYPSQRMRMKKRNFDTSLKYVKVVEPKPLKLKPTRGSGGNAGMSAPAPISFKSTSIGKNEEITTEDGGTLPKPPKYYKEFDIDAFDRRERERRMVKLRELGREREYASMKKAEELAKNLQEKWMEIKKNMPKKNFKKNFERALERSSELAKKTNEDFEKKKRGDIEKTLAEANNSLLAKSLQEKSKQLQSTKEKLAREKAVEDFAENYEKVRQKNDRFKHRQVVDRFTQDLQNSKFNLESLEKKLARENLKENTEKAIQHNIKWGQEKYAKDAAAIKKKYDQLVKDQEKHDKAVAEAAKKKLNEQPMKPSLEEITQKKKKAAQEKKEKAPIKDKEMKPSLEEITQKKKETEMIVDKVNPVVAEEKEKAKEMAEQLKRLKRKRKEPHVSSEEKSEIKKMENEQRRIDTQIGNVNNKIQNQFKEERRKLKGKQLAKPLSKKDWKEINKQELKTQKELLESLQGSSPEVTKKFRERFHEEIYKKGKKYSDELRAKEKAEAREALNVKNLKEFAKLKLKKVFENWNQKQMDKSVIRSIEKNEEEVRRRAEEKRAEAKRKAEMRNNAATRIQSIVKGAQTRNKIKLSKKAHDLLKDTRVGRRMNAVKLLNKLEQDRQAKINLVNSLKLRQTLREQAEAIEQERQRKLKRKQDEEEKRERKKKKK